MSKHWWLYVLKLEHNKWYVGITSKTPEERLQEHALKIRGAYWTMKHKPLGIELTEDLGLVSKSHAEAYENRVTRTLMKERGLNNVRGGDLTNIDDYIKRFGWIWLKEGWTGIIIVIILMAVIIAQSILYYTK